MISFAEINSAKTSPAAQRRLESCPSATYPLFTITINILLLHCGHRSPLTAQGSHRHCTQANKARRAWGRTVGGAKGAWAGAVGGAKGAWAGAVRKAEGRGYGVVSGGEEGTVGAGSKRAETGVAPVKRERWVRRGVVEGGAQRGRREHGRVHLHRFREPIWPPPKAGSKPGSKPA